MTYWSPCMLCWKFHSYLCYNYRNTKEEALLLCGIEICIESLHFCIVTTQAYRKYHWKPWNMSSMSTFLVRFWAFLKHEVLEKHRRQISRLYNWTIWPKKMRLICSSTVWQKRRESGPSSLSFGFFDSRLDILRLTKSPHVVVIFSNSSPLKSFSNFSLFSFCVRFIVTFTKETASSSLAPPSSSRSPGSSHESLRFGGETGAFVAIRLVFFFVSLWGIFNSKSQKLTRDEPQRLGFWWTDLKFSWSDWNLTMNGTKSYKKIKESRSFTCD